MAQHAEQMQRIDVVGIFRKLRAIAVFGFVEAALTVQVYRLLEHALNVSWRWERAALPTWQQTRQGATVTLLASRNYAAWGESGSRGGDGKQTVD